MKKLKQMPVPVAVLIMVLCIVAGVAFGNGNALRDAGKVPTQLLAEVSALASTSANEALNLVPVAKRSNVPAAQISELEGAASAVKSAKGARDMATAQARLDAAVAAVEEQIRLTATGDDAKYATGAKDNYENAKRILGRQVAAYNASALEAEKLHATLPFGWLVGRAPEVYQ